MEIQKVWAVYWSPTGGCRRVTETLAEAAAVRLGVPWECVDITLPQARERMYLFAQTDLVVVGTPTYAARYPTSCCPGCKAACGETAPWRWLWWFSATVPMTTLW